MIATLSGGYFGEVSFQVIPVDCTNLELCGILSQN